MEQITTFYIYEPGGFQFQFGEVEFLVHIPIQYTMHGIAVFRMTFKFDLLGAAISKHTIMTELMIIGHFVQTVRFHVDYTVDYVYQY